jgi:uncharacterized protein with FMN-binding domain/succinate dehydrogenase/fumarate reductase flavoprotein subunit
MKRKKLVLAGLTAAAVLAAAGCSANKSGESTEVAATTQGEAAQAKYQAGTYTGVGQGNNGTVEVEVTFSEDRIEKVEIVNHQEGGANSSEALEKLPGQIVDAQSADVDAISNATNTSNAIKDAVNDCIRQATGKTEESNVNAGTYTGQATGQRGVITVEATVDETGKLTDLTVTDHNETDGIYQAAFEKVIPAILEGQTLNVDAATGATVSSNAIKTATRAALKEAGVAEAFTSADRYPVVMTEAADQDADVVVVGGGLSGMLAAYRAAREGNSVIVLEKNAYLGGSAVRCAGYFYAANTIPQIEAGYEGDEMGELYNPETHPYMNHYLYHGEQEAIDMMTEAGAVFVEPDAFSLKFAPGLGKGGGEVTRVVKNEMDKENITCLMETTGYELLDTDGTINGVMARNAAGEEFTIHAKAVVLSTGGWAYNTELNQLYVPDTADAPRGGNNFATGDAFTMAAPYDAKLSNMEEGFMGYAMTKDTYQYLSFAYSCGILVDMEGNRFFDESNSSYPALDAAVAGLNSDWNYKLVFDENNRKFCGEEGLIDVLVETGAAHMYSSLEELMEAENLPKLADTIDRYNTFVENGTDEDFNRDVNTMDVIATENTTYYCVPATIGFYTSVGGLDVDLDSHVLNNDGEIIPGLYASGEVTGNIMYHDMGVYGGGIASAIGTGWVAGSSVAEDLNAQ